MAAGALAAWGWALWSLPRAAPNWRGVFLAVLVVMPAGVVAMAAGRLLAEVAAGLVLILLSLALLLSYRGPGRLFAVVQLICGMVLAIGTPRPLG
jgi:hypothetical protein